MKLLSKNKSLIISSLAIMMCITGAIIVSNSVKADNPATASATASVTVSSACSMTYNNSSAHTVSMINNSTEENVGVTTLTATCNDAGGLAIYAIGYSNDEYGNTNMIGTTGNIATGTNDSTSNWSMRLYTATGSITPSSITSTFTAVPSTYTKFAELSSGTTGSSALAVNATYRFHISATQPADTYTGKVKYTMVHPATEVPPSPQTTQSGQICYYPNGTNVVGSMGCQTVSTSATSATLLASNFSREGYGFAGWSTTFDYSDNTGFLGPQETISFNAGQYTGSNPGLSLYAHWVKSAGSLQSWTGCSSLATGAVTALTDQRDNDTYAIAKLADGKCWMIENMRLDNTPELSSTNTNNPSLPLTNIYDATNPTTSNHLSASTNPTSTAWCTNTNAACYDQSMLYTGNTTERGTNPATNANTYSYGNYYNWYSATAGNGKYANGYGYTAPGDLCPAGWTLPTSGSASMNFGLLDVALGGTGSTSNSSTTPTGAVMSAAYRSYPNNFLYSGGVNGSSVSSRGSYGYYWSKSAGSSSSAYNLLFGSSYVLPSNDFSKYYGFSVRCLAQ